MEYIIYSNGNKGYGLYDSSENFPEFYEDRVKSLYTSYGGIAEDDESGARSVRLAPMGDGYVVSVIFRGCNNSGDRRSMIATVNWILNDEEVLDLFAADVCSLPKIMQDSADILKSKGYNLPAVSMDNKVDSIYPERKQALMTAAYSATENGKASRNAAPGQQVFVGCESFVDAFEMAKSLYATLPVAFYKYLSIYIGAVQTSETYGSALVFMSKDKLKSPNRNAGHTQTASSKLVEYDGVLSKGVPNPIARYMQLSEQSLEYLDKFSKYIGDDPCLYWTIIRCLYESQKDTAFNLKEFLRHMGEDFVIELLENNAVPQREHVEYIKRKKGEFAQYKKLMSYVKDKLSQYKQQDDEAKRQEAKQKEEEEQRRKSATKKGTNNRGINTEKDMGENYIPDDRRCEDVDQPETKLIPDMMNLFRSRTAGEAEKAVDSDEDKKSENEPDKDNANLFGLTGSLMKNYKLLYLAIAVLSFAVIVLVDVFAFIMATKLSAGALSDTLVNKAVTIQYYILTIVGLNLVNIPVGFAMIASLFELIKEYLNRK